MSQSTHCSFRNRNVNITLVEFINYLQENVSLIHFDPCDAVKIYNKAAKNACLLPLEVNSNSSSVAAVDLALKELLVKLPFEDAVEHLIEPSLPLLDKIVINSLQCLDDDNMEDMKTIDEALLTCEQSVECLQMLVPYIALNCKQSNDITDLPSSLPSTLLSLLHSVLIHCKHRGSWYEEHGSDDTRELMSKLFRNTVDTTTALFGALADITRAAAATAPCTTGKILTQASSLCRLLSLLSEMKAVVCGWKSLSLLVQDIVTQQETKRVMLEGGLQLLQVLQELDQEVQEGLDLLYTLQGQKTTGTSPSSEDVVIRRVVKLCSFCVKLALTLSEAFLEHAGNEVLYASVCLAARLSRCCVCVSLLHNAEGECFASTNRVVFGDGPAEQLLLGVQLLLTALTKQPSFSQILPECVCIWITEVEQLEQQHLQCETALSSSIQVMASAGDPIIASQSPASTVPSTECWGSVTGGPYLLLCCTALLLPDAAHRTPAAAHLPIALLASLLSYIPYCSGLLNSLMAVKSLDREGQAPSAIPLYEAAVVAASVAVAGVKGSVWHEAEPWLWGALLALPQLPGKALATEGQSVKDDDACDESEDEDFFFRGSQRSRTTEAAKKISVEKDVVKGCQALANKVAEGSRDWLWPHLLGADTLAFAARLGSVELCSSLHEGLCAALPSLPVSDDALVPHLAQVIVRIQRFLPSPPDDLPCKAECKEESSRVREVNSYVSGLCLFDGGSVSYSAAYRERCTAHAQALCDDVVDTLRQLLQQSDETASVIDLEHQLRCLHLLLLPRLRAETPTDGPAAATSLDPLLQEVAGALVTLWERFPDDVTGDVASAWLLSGLAAATAPLLDLLHHSQLMVVLSVCGRGGEGAAVQEAVAAVVQGLARCTLPQPPLEQQKASEAVAVCAALVSEERSWWVLQCSLEAFLHLAQHTPHKQMVAAVLQQCSSTAKVRLQKFLLQEPHPPPLSSRWSAPSGDTQHTNGTVWQSSNKTGPKDPTSTGVKQEGRLSRSGSKDEVSMAAAPLFLFHQQCVINASPAWRRRRLDDDARNTSKTSEEKQQEDFANEDRNAVGYERTVPHERLALPSKRHRGEEDHDDLISKITLSISQSKQRWSLLSSEQLSNCGEVPDVFRYAEALAASLENLHSTVTQKRAKILK